MKKVRGLGVMKFCHHALQQALALIVPAAVFYLNRDETTLAQVDDHIGLAKTSRTFLEAGA
jgi:hypothetical protein